MLMPTIVSTVLPRSRTLPGSGTPVTGSIPPSAINVDSTTSSTGVPGGAIVHDGSTYRPTMGSQGF
jgi:hypothetical protein